MEKLSIVGDILGSSVRVDYSNGCDDGNGQMVKLIMRRSSPLLLREGEGDSL